MPRLTLTRAAIFRSESPVAWLVSVHATEDTRAAALDY
jgi:hypothetical protein